MLGSIAALARTAKGIDLLIGCLVCTPEIVALIGTSLGLR